MTIDLDKRYTKEEIAELFHYSISTIQKSWKRTEKELQKKGYNVTKHQPNDISKTIYYTIEEIKPHDFQDLPGEIWITSYCDNSFEVSNKGRVRNKVSQKLYKLYCETSRGNYLTVKINSQKYRVDRLIKISFDPIEDPENYDVDHIDGNRQNNNLENLRYASSEKNTFSMMLNRDKIQLAITEKLKNGWSYDEILEIINNLPNKCEPSG